MSDSPKDTAPPVVQPISSAAEADNPIDPEGSLAETIATQEANAAAKADYADIGPVLTDLQCAKLETIEWKLKAHEARVAMSQDLLNGHKEEFRLTVEEWKQLMKETKVDPERSYFVDDSNVIHYEKKAAPPSQPPPPPGKFTRV